MSNYNVEEETEEEIALGDLNIYNGEDTRIIPKAEWDEHSREKKLIEILSNSTDYAKFLMAAQGVGLHVSAKFDREWFNTQKRINQTNEA